MRHIYLLMREKSLFGKPASTQCTSARRHQLLLVCPPPPPALPGWTQCAFFRGHIKSALHKRCYQNALKWLCHKRTMRTTWPMEITYVRLAAWLVVCCPKRVKSPFGPPTTTPQSKPFIISSSRAKPPWPKRDFEEAPPATTIQSLQPPSARFLINVAKSQRKSVHLFMVIILHIFLRIHSQPPPPPPCPIFPSSDWEWLGLASKTG